MTSFRRRTLHSSFQKRPERPSITSFIDISSTGVKSITPLEIMRSKEGASNWLAANGFIEEAIHHALAAGDEITAAQLVEQSRHELLNREDWHTLERWLNLLPPEIVQQRPALILAKAWTLHNQYLLQPISPLLEEAQILLNSNGANLTEADKQALQGEKKGA